jgi:hypothetical protein
VGHAERIRTRQELNVGRKAMFRPAMPQCASQYRTDRYDRALARFRRLDNCA